MQNYGNGAGDSVVRSKPACRLIILFVLVAAAFPASFMGVRGPLQQENVIKTSIAKAKALSDAGRFREALTLLEQAVKTAVAKPEQDELRVALADTHISWAAGLKKNYENAAEIEQYKAAFDIDKEIRQKSAADDLNNIGVVYSDLGEKKKAMEYFEQVLPIRRAVGDRRGEATTLSNIGSVHSDLGENKKALDYYEQVLPIRRAIGDRGGEATTLNNIGGVYADLGEKRKALEYYEQALHILRAVGDRRGEATTLSNIGGVYADLGEKRKALEYYEQALHILRAVGDRRGEATTLSNIGVVYAELGENQKALEYFEQALPMHHAVGDRRVEAVTLDNIAGVYCELGEKKKALEYYGQVLPIRRAVGDRPGEATTLSNIGVVYAELGENQKALEYFEQALPIHRAVGDRQSEGRTLSNIGVVYAKLGEKKKVLEYFEQALPIRRAVGDRAGEAETLNNMMVTLEALSEPGVAIFFGKQAVNIYQQLRADIQGLDKELQKTYAKKVERTYRDLADLLISRSRLPEAEQVLDLLKQEEYFNFVRRAASEASSLDGRATPNPDEAEWGSRYEAIADKVAELGLRHGNLAIKKNRTTEEDTELKRLDSDLAAAGRAFHEFLDNLAKEFSATAPGRDQFVQIREAESLMEDLRELGKGTVAIYTLVGDEKTRIILITPDIQIARESQITRTDLAAKVGKFRQALMDREDPRELGRDLYGILIEPIAKDLVQAGARTLMWSLDRDLRYLPIAALYDGKGYFLERYCNVVFTPASNARLKDLPIPHWQGLGLGVSKEHEGFKPLSFVPAELHGIFREEPKFPGGVIKGNVLLDNDFTVDAMKDALGKRMPLVHIASHFQFAPGNERDSFLLLGDGNHLTLDQVRASSNLFGGVELLTLSACETAMGGEGEGTEVEGFAVTAQRQGAKAVIASLWSIADASTSLLMREFYRVREATPGMPKAEALRQAQLALLQGRIKPVGNKGASSSIESYAHPYYWAPFILIGNWR